MCDTLFTDINGRRFFAKNSDRSCNEPNLTVFVPQTDYVGKRHCTYIQIEDLPTSANSMILTKPSWMFGAEMGVNDKGVAIGNEALFTRRGGKKTPSLIGMDLLRLALECADSAQKAVEIICSLIDRYGQGGNCGFDKPFYYDNSFLIADKNTALVLETCGKSYATREIADFGNISNRISIEEFYRHTEPLVTHFCGSKERETCARFDVSTAHNLADVVSCLRSHEITDQDNLYLNGSLRSVCMHQSALGDHTTGSMVYDFSNNVVFTTGCSTPCLSIFKPVTFTSQVAPLFEDEKKSFAYWLDREKLIRSIFAGVVDASKYSQSASKVQEEILDGYVDLTEKSGGYTQDKMDKFVETCSKKESDFIESYRDVINYFDRIESKGVWKKYNPKLGANVFERELKKRV